MCYREEVSLLERNKYKFSPLALPEELPALFHGEKLLFSCFGSDPCQTPHAKTFKWSCHISNTLLFFFLIFKMCISFKKNNLSGS